MLLDPDLAAWEILKSCFQKAISRREPDIYERNTIEALTSNSMRKAPPAEQHIEFLLNNYAWNESGNNLVLCLREKNPDSHDDWEDGLAPLMVSRNQDSEKTIPVEISDVLDEEVRRVGRKYTDAAMSIQGRYTSDMDVFSIMLESHKDKMEFNSYLHKIIDENPEGITEENNKSFRQGMEQGRKDPNRVAAFEAYQTGSANT